MRLTVNRLVVVALIMTAMGMLPVTSCWATPSEPKFTPSPSVPPALTLVPSPSPAPALIQIQQSQEDIKILRSISEKLGIPLEHLQLTRSKGTSFSVDPLTGREVWLVIAVDNSAPNRPSYEMVIDSEYKAITPAEWEQINASFKDRYSKKLDGILYNRIRRIAPEDNIKVEIWLVRSASRSSLIQLIESRGYAVTSPSKFVPTLFAEIPKDLVLKLSQAPEIDIIYLWTTHDDMTPGTQETVLVGTDLAFETIKVEKLEPYKELTPDIYVIASSKDPLLAANKWVSSYDIMKVDFSRHFVLLVFQGYKAQANFGIEIKRISQEGDTIYVAVHLTEPLKGDILSPLASSYYHVVKVSRKNVEQFGNITFRLLDQTGETKAVKVQGGLQ